MIDTVISYFDKTKLINYNKERSYNSGKYSIVNLELADKDNKLILSFDLKVKREKIDVDYVCDLLRECDILNGNALGYKKFILFAISNEWFPNMESNDVAAYITENNIYHDLVAEYSLPILNNIMHILEGIDYASLQSKEDYNKKERAINKLKSLMHKLIDGKISSEEYEKARYEQSVKGGLLLNDNDAKHYDRWLNELVMARLLP